MLLSRFLFPAFSLAVCAAFTASVSAEVILLDFEQNQTTAAGYNSINAPAAAGSTVFADLTDTDGNTTDVDLTLSSAAGFARIPSASTGGQSIFVEDAAGDGIRNGNSSTDGLITVTFTGLDAGAAYDLQLFANSGLFFTADVDYTFGTQTFAGTDPTTETFLDFDNQTATGGSLTLSIQANGSGNAFSRGSAINAARLERVDAVVPEPGSLALVGLGTLLVLRRRRADA